MTRTPIENAAQEALVTPLVMPRVIERAKDAARQAVAERALAKLYDKIAEKGKLDNDAEWAEFRRLRKECQQPVVKTEEQLAKSRRSRNNKHKGTYHEKRVARKLGGRKDGAVGHADVKAGPFAPEVKSMTRIPMKITKAMSEARRLAGSRTPVVVFCCNSPSQNVVIMAEQDFYDWYGKLDLKHAKHK